MNMENMTVDKILLKTPIFIPLKTPIFFFLPDATDHNPLTALSKVRTLFPTNTTLPIQK